MSDKPLTVDMLGAARDAKWSALAFMGPGSVRAMAPAKVNLFLGVGERRADGRHEVLTVMHAIALHDTLHVQVRPADQAPDGDDLPSHAAVGGPACNLRVTVDVTDKGAGGVPDIPACENIVFRAADLLASALGQDAPCAIDVRLEKAIPHQAGLGGGSSDAAAMLLALARAWGLAADDGRLEEAAAALGAGVLIVRGALGAAGAGLDVVGPEIVDGVADPAAEVAGRVGHVVGRVAHGVLGLAVEALGLSGGRADAALDRVAPRAGQVAERALHLAAEFPGRARDPIGVDHVVLLRRRVGDRLRDRAGGGGASP